MIIKQVFNNNVVLTTDENDQEVIVMGNGLGFGKKAGQFLKKSVIDKRFVIEDKEVQDKFVDLLSQLPEDVVNLTTEAVGKAQETLHADLNESVFVTLADHLANVLQNGADYVTPKNYMIWDIKRYYPKEFSVGQYVLQYIQKNYGFHYPEDEAGFIALHIVNAEQGAQGAYALEITELIQALEKILRNKTQDQLDKDSIQYYRFITHLRFLALRVAQGNIDEASTSENLFLHLAKENYPKSFEIATLMSRYIDENYAFRISSDETLYLIMHLAKIIKE
ncbi:PRD domain-containing protein [Enterococcus sp. DIV0876]|uniref:PRD domain-containing protein n=1 Tax=Enterococcus sp. DIV0876 TaxID=2774633 RepID=UPI003D2FB5BD